MKKFLDRYLFSRLGLQMLFSVVAIALFALFGTLIRNWATDHSASDIYSQVFWGFRQITDGGSMAGTLDGLDEVATESKSVFAAPVVLVIALVSWLIGMVLYGFVAGAVANAFAGRKEKIDAGLVRYRFRDHGIVIGWDFQGASCVRELLRECREVLVVSATAAEEIRNDLEVALGGDLASCVYIYNGQIAVDEDLLRDSWPELSKRIVILGDGNGEGDDGGNLYIERILRDHIKKASASLGEKRPPVKVHLHIANPVLYTHALAVPKEGFAENDDLMDLEVFNYYESWAWRCWSAKGAGDGDAAYLPIRHRPDAERVELFIVGASPMGQAMASYAMPLMNYGEDRKHCKITIFDESSGGAFLPEKWALDAMPEVEVEYKCIDGGSDEANDIMIAAASDPKVAVTVVVATPGADAAVRSYAQLANSLRRMDVSVLVWQATASGKCPRKPFLQTCGDRAKLRFFGMTDVLPWLDPARQDGGRAVNHYYDVAFDSSRGLPKTSDPQFAEAAVAVWDKGRAEQLWMEAPRWSKWSSVNSGDSFKEKAAAFPDCLTNAESRMKLLRVEHNRWWTERLLSGWKPCEKPAEKARQKELKASYMHWDMVPFDQLDAFTQDLDRVCIAAMAACGFVDAKRGQD